MSLKRIVLRDFVIVQELDLDLSGGFTVLTGETGAGKSILIDALQLATGGRADVGVIREGTTRADISVEFEMSPTLQDWLCAAGFDRGEELLLRRTVDTQGKSRAWINGSPATATQLREIGEQLLDIHGQHAWQSLTRPEAVRSLLDGYAQVNTSALSTLWQQWRQAQTALSEAHAAQESLQRERERLTWQIGELDKLAPQVGEWTDLNTEHGRLSNGQALLDAAQQALNRLDREDNGTRSALNSACQALQAQAHLEPEFVALSELLASSLAQVEDAAHSLRTYLRRSEPDPQRLTELDNRMSQWLSLARRYRRSPEELPTLLAGWRSELTQLEAAADLAGLSQAEQTAQAAYLKQARAISAARRKAAPILAKSVTQAMQGLGMQGGQFEVSLHETTQACQHGLEDVGFLVAGHIGSSARPISKVASGGELSRIALAIAVTTSQLGLAQTLIFDEVDAGIGGAVAETVGRLMKQLGVDRQVLAVSHLPQVATCADHHLVVSKQLRGSSTVSSIHAVAGEQRVAEIARMLGGEHLSGTTLAHAKEMLRARQMP